jgi:hypothetical protein
LICKITQQTKWHFCLFASQLLSWFVYNPLRDKIVQVRLHVTAFSKDVSPQAHHRKMSVW